MLEDLETIDDDAEKFSVYFVKINDKRLAKSYGIEKFPALTFFRDEEMTLFEGAQIMITLMKIYMAQYIMFLFSNFRKFRRSSRRGGCVRIPDK